MYLHVALISANDVLNSCIMFREKIKDRVHVIARQYVKSKLLPNKLNAHYASTHLYFRYIEESIPWLVANGHTKRAEKVMRKAAKVSRVKLPQNIFNPSVAMTPIELNVDGVKKPEVEEALVDDAVSPTRVFLRLSFILPKGSYVH